MRALLRTKAYRALAERLRDLLSPGAAERPSRALLTSREWLADIPSTVDNASRGLARSASHGSLRQEARDRGATDRRGPEKQLLDGDYDATQGMPLPMKLVARQYLLGLPVHAALTRPKGAQASERYRCLSMPPNPRTSNRRPSLLPRARHAT